MAISSALVERPELAALKVNVTDFAPAPRTIIGTRLLLLRKFFYGPDAGAYYEAVLRDSRAADRLQARVDEHGVQSARRLWGLNDADQAREYLMKQARTANSTIQHLVDTTLPDWDQNYSLMDELDSPSDNPSSGIKWAARAVGDGDEQMLYEVGRGELLKILAGEINARTRQSRIGTVRSSIKDALFDFYQGPIKTKPYTLVSEHDEETGKVVRIGDVDFGSSNSTHTRIREYKVRSVEGIGPVKVGDRKKKDEDAILKAITKARWGNGLVSPDDSTDTFGITLTVMEPGKEGYEERVLDLQGRFIEHMRSHGKGANKLSNRITGFEIDDGTDGKRNADGASRGSSPSHRFSSRLQMHLEGVGVPFEVIFKTAEQMRNDEVMHGVLSSSVLKEWQYDIFEKETGVSLRGKLYDGPAHDLYKAQRMIPALPILLPADIYGPDVVKRALDNLGNVANRLKMQDRAPSFKFDWDRQIGL